MTDYEFVCHECGRTFRGLTSRIGGEMCPECGSIDLARVPAPPAKPDDTAAHAEAPKASDTSE